MKIKKELITLIAIGLSGILFSLFLGWVVIKQEKSALSKYGVFQFNTPIEANQEPINQKVGLEKTFEQYHYLSGRNIDLDDLFSKVPNIPDFMFFTIFFHWVEDLFFVNETEFFKPFLPRDPLTRFFHSEDYCFNNFLYIFYQDREFSQTNVGFEYTLTNETVDFLKTSFGGNYWPEPYRKRRLRQEEARKKAQGPNFNFANEYEYYIKQIYVLDTRIKIFWTSTYWHKNHLLGKHYSCMFQTSNHIPGNDYMSLKNHFVQAHRQYTKIYENRTQCFSIDSLVPTSFLLRNKEECENFFKLIDQEDYNQTVREKGPIYIRKVAAGSHRGFGVEVVDAAEEGNLREIYANGSKCGQQDPNYMIQKYVTNPLLVEGHKFDFRVYLFVVSTDPLIAYFHDGFLKVSLFPYDPLSTEKASHVTSTELSKKIFKQVEEGDTSFNKTSAELRDFQLWSFTRFHEYLMKAGLVNDTNWIENFLRPAFRRAFIHITQMNYKYFIKNPTVNEMFGVDLMFDTDFNLWLLEVNSNPELMPTNDYKEIFFHNLLKENIEVSFAYVKSKARRIVDYVLNLKETILQGISPDSREIESTLLLIESRLNRDKIRADISQLAKNKLNLDFFPKNNSHQIVVDYSQNDPENVFDGLLGKECVLNFDDLQANYEGITKILEVPGEVGDLQMPNKNIFQIKKKKKCF